MSHSLAAEPRNLVVEFVGLPASGKTHLASAVQQRLATERGVETAVTMASEKRASIRLPVAGAYLLAHAINSPARSTRLFGELVRSRQRNLLKLSRYALYQYYVCEEIRRARESNELHLSDQGILQHLWRVYLTAHSMTQEDLVRAIDRFPSYVFPDLVVFVDVDHRTRMQRGVDRGTPVEPEYFDPEHPEIQRDFEAYRAITGAIYRIAHEPRNGLRIVHIDNTEEHLDRNVANLCTEILRVWDGTNGSTPSMDREET